MSKLNKNALLVGNTKLPDRLSNALKIHSDKEEAERTAQSISLKLDSLLITNIRVKSTDIIARLVAVCC